MRRALVLACSFGVAVAIAADVSAQDGGTPPTPPPAPACISHRKEVRFSGAGYDHIVYVKNACETAAACTVSTNVNPTPSSLRVAPGREESVLTFRGSPATEFTAQVRCTLNTAPPPPRP